MRKSIMLAAAVFATAGVATAWAHAHLQRAVPAVGSTVQTAPKEVSLWFTQELEGSLSGVEVANDAGKRVDSNDAHLDPGDKKQMVATLAGIGPGVYKVRWHAVSVDTHRTEGDYSFTVKP